MHQGRKIATLSENNTYASVVPYTIFLSEGRKINFRVPYRISREILNVLQVLPLVFCGLYTGRKNSFFTIPWPKTRMWSYRREYSEK